MKSRNAAAVVLAMIFLTAPLPSGGQEGKPASSSDNHPANADVLTTQKDRAEISLAVYDTNLAFVRDVRQLRLPAGAFSLAFEDVPASVNPVTVEIRSLSDPGKLLALEQNYDFDQLDPQTLLRKYIGREVVLVRREREAGSTKWVETKALLLSYNHEPVWKIGDEIVTGMAAESYRFPALPPDLHPHPTLVWRLENRGPSAQRVETSYLTGNMNWSANYVLTVASDAKTADLEGWVTLMNNSGASFNNASVQLVAGEVHRATPPAGILPRPMAMSAAAPLAPGIQQEAFAGYHLYTLGRRTSIQDKETKQIRLLSGTGIPIERYLSTEGQPYYYRSAQGTGNAMKQPVRIYYRFQNSAQSGLGIPLPAGVVRLYAPASRGGPQFIGEDSISHTPRGEAVRLYAGDAFDIECERRQIAWQKISGNTYEMEYQIALRNHQDVPVTVEVREPVGGDWTLENANFKWTKLDSSTLGFDVPVDKNGAAMLDYRVRVKW